MQGPGAASLSIEQGSEHRRVVEALWAVPEDASVFPQQGCCASIANDGVKVRPHIIKEIRQADGKVISAAKPEKTRVVSAEAAASLRRMLREVVVTGTGKEAALDGYSSAGKTGTAWKYDPKIKRVSGSKYTSSFVGYAPAENPAVVIAVVMDEPRGALRNGGQVSAPVFREIAQQVLPELNVPHDMPTQEEIAAAATAQEEVPSEPDAITDSAISLDSKTASTKNSESKSVEKTDKKAAETPEKKSQKEKVVQREKAVPGKPPKEIKSETDKSSNKSPKNEKNSGKPKPILDREKPKGDTENKSSTERARIVN